MKAKVQKPYSVGLPTDVQSSNSSGRKFFPSWCSMQHLRFYAIGWCNNAFMTLNFRSPKNMYGLTTIFTISRKYMKRSTDSSRKCSSGRTKYRTMNTFPWQRSLGPSDQGIYCTYRLWWLGAVGTTDLTGGNATGPSHCTYCSTHVTQKSINNSNNKTSSSSNLSTRLHPMATHSTIYSPLL